jgi:outer membrane protein assembly factor BamB
MRYGRVRAAILGLVAACVPLSAQAAAPVWPNYHQDLGHAGNDTAEPPLSAVGSQWTSAPLDGDVYAEPIVVGHVVIVATENNTLYGLDAASGGIIWRTHLAPPVTGGLPCGNILPIGITSTPVADPAAGIVYAVGSVPTPSLHYQLWALNLNNSGRLLWQQTITPANTPGQVAFDPSVHNQRGALALANDRVYIPFGGRDGDCGNYRGWVAAAPASGPGALYSFELPTGHAGGGLWNAGGLAVDGSGNVYGATGNTFCGTGCPSYDFSESVIKLSPTLAFLDYFVPSNWEALNDGDVDLGTVGPTVLGSSGLVFQVGKEGIGYLLNQNALGGGGNNHTTPAYSARVCTRSSDAAFGSSAYMAPYLFVPCSDRLEVVTVNTSTPSFTSVGHGPAVSRSGPAIVSQGLAWTIDPDNGVLYGLNPASPTTPVVTVNLPNAAEHFVTPAAGDGRIFVGDANQVVGLGDFAISTNQYRLTGNDGSRWEDIDAANLSVTIKPSSNVTAIVGGNADLWTANAGINQDLGIAVTVNGGADSLIGWKESGGKSGTFSPNAAFVQSVYSMSSGNTYVFKLEWKTNIPEGSGTILAGAGPLMNLFSPTSLSVHILAAGPNPYDKVSTAQYVLPANDGSTWTDIDSSSLSQSITPASNVTAIIGGNADLWTATAGVNQDLGIFISGGSFGSGQLVAWKESGGNAGTFSPNAAFVQTVVSLSAATAYTIKLQWKSNLAAGSGTVYAGAGGAAPFSPTRLTVETVSTLSNVSAAASTTQYRLANSNGLGWQDVDATNLKLTITPAANGYVLLGGNADLWTENATFNQDLGISVSIDGDPDWVLAWKESGGFAGTFSPNAAFVQDVFAVATGHSYIFKLKWKTNKPQPAGDGIRAGAGLGPDFSPTSLSAELISG